MKIPPEVDGLMWGVAENPTDKAVEEFVVRFPNQRAELMKRINMVRDLKHQVKPADPLHRELPRFHPTPPGPTGPPAGWPIAAGLGVLALATLAFAGYSFSRPQPAPPPPVPKVNLEPPTLPPVNYVTPGPPPSQPLTPPTTQPTQPTSAPVDNTPTYMKPQETVAFKDESLVNVLTMLTAASGMHAIIGPNFQDQKVTFTYHNKSAVEVLLDLSKQYAFTVSDEGGGNFLILPIPDSGNRDFDGNSAVHQKVGP
jgi:hypothetical protein